MRYAEFVDGEEVWSVAITDGLFVRSENGAVVDGPRPVTDDDIEMYVPAPDPRESALVKLQALGLTEAEALALVGGL